MRLQHALLLIALVACGDKDDGSGDDASGTDGTGPADPSDLDGDGYDVTEDCNDADSAVNPGASEEPYNGVDDDCDEATPDDDLDGDGFALADDCDDANPAINPSATEEVYTGVDEDCDEATPDDDLDGDGFALADDCDDDNAEINPAAAEIPLDGIDNDCDPDTCTGAGFSDPADVWALPPRLGDDWQDAFFEDSAEPCTGGERQASGLVDLTGDGLPDLVFTDTCDAAGVGTDDWLVYENLGDGFAEDAASWALPTADGDDWFDDFAKDTAEGCAEGELSTGLVDLNGDALPDLVVADGCDIDRTGTTHWLFYENLGTGFSTTGTIWSLPSPRSEDDALDDLAVDSSRPCGTDTLTSTLLDLTGDGLVDLVLTDACDRGGVGETHWSLYENTGSGFSTTAQDWALPPGIGTDDWLDDPRKDTGVQCPEGSLSNTLLDLTGDGLVDLVFTDFCDADDVGTDRWLVHANTGAGFASTPTDWALPTPLRDDWLDDDAEDSPSPCELGSFSAVVFDLTADGVVDLVVTDGCDEAGVGTDRWAVHLGGAAGFSTEATDWPLPAGPRDDWMDDVAESSTLPCGTFTESLTAGVVDLNGDGLPDLVATDWCDTASVGTDSWSLFAARCEQ